MSLVQLKAFHYVAACGGFSSAGQLLGRTQPAMSDNVSRLEHEYNVLLFHRSRSGVTLTDVGKKLYRITGQLFNFEGQAFDLLSRSKELGNTRLRLMADAPIYVSPLIIAFRLAYPKVVVSLRTGNTDEVYASLSDYRSEVGLLGSKAGRTGFSHQRIGRSPIVAFCSRRHELASKGAVSWEELARLPLVMRETGSRTRQKVVDEASRLGIFISPAIETEGREGLRELVAGGAGVGFISEAELGWDDRVVGIPIEGRGIFINESLVCLAQRADVPVVKAFWDTAGALKKE